MPTTRPKLAGWPLGFLVGFAFFLIYRLRYVLIPFALAGALAYVLTPAIQWLQQRTRWPRRLVALGVYLIVVAALGEGVWRIGLRLAESARPFTSGPQQLHQFVARLLGGEEITFLGQHLSASDLAGRMQDAINSFISRPPLAGLAGLAAGVAFGVVLSLVLLFFLLLQGPELAHGALQLAPPEYRPGLRAFASQAHPVLSRYIDGLTVIVLYTMFVVWVGAAPLFHLPDPMFLAVVAGFLELLPVAGPTLSAFLLAGTAVAHGGTAWTFIEFGVFWIALRLSIDQVVGPVILGRAMRLPPVVVIFAFIAGGTVLGPLGILLAIPTTALLKLALDNYYAVPPE